MDFKQIQELIKMINKSNIGELTVEQKDFRITIKQKEEQITQVVSAPMPAMPVRQKGESAHHFSGFDENRRSHKRF